MQIVFKLQHHLIRMLSKASILHFVATWLLNAIGRTKAQGGHYSILKRGPVKEEIQFARLPPSMPV